MAPHRRIQPMTSDNEGEEDGVPFGLLMWGQAGIYNAVDDRLTIAALSDSAVGVVRPTRLSAGAGLTVNVAAGWMAIAGCDDGTSAVVGSRQTHQLEIPGGGTTTRQYHVWIDVNPDEGRWEMRPVPVGETLDRFGVSLGRITVPPGANLATQFTFSRLVPTIGRHGDCPVVSPEASGTGWVRMTPPYPIAPYQLHGNRAFLLKAYGHGIAGPAVQWPQFRGGGGLGAQPAVQVETTGGVVGARERFDWTAEVMYQMRADGGGMRSRLTITLTRIGAVNALWTGTSRGQNNRTLAVTRTTYAHSYNREWQELFLEASWSGVSAGQVLGTAGSTFETYEPYDA